MTKKLPILKKKLRAARERKSANDKEQNLTYVEDFFCNLGKLLAKCEREDINPLKFNYMSFFVVENENPNGQDIDAEELVYTLSHITSVTNILTCLSSYEESYSYDDESY